MLAVAAGCELASQRRAPYQSQLRPPVVLITVDALRPDHLGVYGYERPTSPKLERLASDSLVFTSAFAAAPKTMPSVPQMLTSSYFPDIVRPQTLMSVLDEAAYDGSAAVIHNPYLGKWTKRLRPTFSTVVAGALSAE
jgi:glucan phosphoethanolaminetransferase (alkaline phosphatase superfamily)